MLIKSVKTSLLLLANVYFIGNRCTHAFFTRPFQHSTVERIAFYTTSAKRGNEVNPKDVFIPEKRIDFSYARSSGPGGQNVNKVNTKAELRFHVLQADWIEIDIRRRIIEYQSNKINNEGFLCLSSQEHRTQEANKKECLTKLREIIAEATPEPKERVMRVGLTAAAKENRMEEKRHRKAVKESRRKSDWDD